MISGLVTVSGLKVDPFAPAAEAISLHDIAHALSMLCRFGGHTFEFYSVAQHSVLVARYLEERYNPRVALFGLLHDASEAYLLDVPRPIKALPQMQWYRDVEASFQATIYRRFGLHEDEPAEVRHADDLVLGVEIRHLRPDALEPGPSRVIEHPEIACWRPAVAAAVFKDTYARLSA